jgi:hypothetical protein
VINCSVCDRMIGYGPGHVKALNQISMVQRGRSLACIGYPPQPWYWKLRTSNPHFCTAC